MFVFQASKHFDKVPSTSFRLSDPIFSAILLPPNIDERRKSHDKVPISMDKSRIGGARIAKNGMVAFLYPLSLNGGL
jgi:hypothetical protein